MSIKQTKVWIFFSSVKLAIWLIAIIALLSLLGTLIPQNQDSSFYIDRFGQVGYQVLSKTGLTHMYATWWFALSLILFALNLTTCLISRFSLKRRSLGILISHGSILVILLGALIGVIFGEKGYIKIGKTEEVNSFVANSNKQVDLGFSLRLDDFVYTENIDAKEKLLVYSAQKDACCSNHDSSNPQAQEVGAETPIAEISPDVNRESSIGQTGYTIKVLRYLPDFVMNTATKEIISRSAIPNNPALEVEVKDKNGRGKIFWVFARFADMHQADTNFRFVYNWQPRRPKDFISKVTIIKNGEEIMSKAIRVNDPLHFGGYTFFQYSYDNQTHNWSGLQAVKDPGVYVIYSGFILLIVGLIIVFYINPLWQRR